LKKAHELLELQGYSLPPLTFTAPMSAKPPATEANRFTRDIAPIFVARCGRCHITKSEGKLSLQTFASLMQGADGEAVIEPGSADDSRLIEMLLSGDMPASGRKLGGNQIATIAAWINAGAKIDYKHKDTPLTRLTPDTKIEPAPRVPSPPQVGKGPVSFAGHIAPVLAANCTGCHGARNPRARLSMVDFTRLMRGGENGPAITPGKGAASLIIRKLKGTEGARMPLERPALPSQTIAAVERWIDEGAKFDGQNPAQTLVELSALYLAKTATHAELGQQRGELAEKNWNLSIPDERPNVVELPNLRLYGTASEAKLKTISSLANEQTDTVRKLLSVPRDLPFVKGGVTFFVFSRRIDYSEFARMVEKRSVPRDWRGHGKFTIADAYIALVPPKTGTEGLPSLVAQQLASVHLGSLTAGKGPRWLTEGLARAVAAKIAPKDSRVKQWQVHLTELKRSASSSADFLTPTLPPADADVLSYGFAASLVKDSSRLKRFLTELGKGTSTEDAFSKAFGASVKERADTWLRSGRRRKR
jgi:mono/diheme cytochrome c family protein